MTDYLRGMRILFFGPKTFNYERELVRAMERLGAEVTYEADKPWNRTWLKGLFRLFPRVAWLGADYYYRNWLDNVAPKTVDVVFVIKGEGLSPDTLRRMKEIYPTARFVLYLWDSINNVPLIERKFQFFDVLYSFDPKDCESHKNLRYRPLFFLDYYNGLCAEKPSEKKCFFLGTLNGDRPHVLWSLHLALHDGYFLDYWLFIRSALELFMRKLFDRSLRYLDSDRLIGTAMTPAIIAERVSAAAAVVDIEHPNQTGLTMRTFEVLASGRKLITTNRHVKNESFFDPSRVLVIDRFSPIVPISFLESEFIPLPEEFFRRYSIAGWLSDVLSVSVSATRQSLT